MNVPATIPARVVEDVAVPRFTGPKRFRMPISEKYAEVRPPTGQDRLDIIGTDMRPREAVRVMLERCCTHQVA